MDDLYKGESAAERATLYHIKNKFGHRSVKKKVMDNVSHVSDLIEFATDGLVCLLAMKILNTDDIENIKSTDEDFLQNLSASIVQSLWPEMDKDSMVLNNAAVNQPDIPGDDDDDNDQDDDYDDGMYCLCKAASISGQHICTIHMCSFK